MVKKRCGCCRGEILSYKSRHKKIWDIFILAFAILNSLFAPVALAFEPVEFQHPVFSIWDKGVDVVFAIDFILMFRTSYKGRKGEEIKKNSKIAKHYIMTTTFLYDALALLGAFWFNEFFGELRFL